MIGNARHYCTPCSAQQMAARGQIPPAFERHPVQASGMIRHGPFPGLFTASGQRLLEPRPPELLENKIAVQAAEIERLAGENRRLAATHLTLEQELVVAQREVHRISDHIRSIQREHDIQNRILQDKMRKMQEDIKAGESVKRDLQKAHMEAQNLVAAGQELTAHVQKAAQELQKAEIDVKHIPDFHSELDSLRQEHQRLRTTFEYEKGINIEQVEQLQAMEKNLIGMARELENLRAEVLNAENRALAPNLCGGSYMNPDSSYPPPIRSAGAYVDSFGRPLVQMDVGPAGDGMIPYSTGNGAAVGASVPSAGSASVPGGAYDPSLAQR
ncbi:protein FLX-like 4 isoform X1 [Juglans microcarpa x Juglans regia]|uniref:protein FLX-like 4 isoform X1 n=2 Tax=Juglans microcarpa x Juglans regia TaxID=2249226 RepID=UPI001B7F0695|nr:protein FLX-like 4 isoform X1 [Juglans microcarpa x Juglans regia]